MSASTVLVADDDRSIRTVVSHALGRAGFDVRSTGNAATLWRWISDGDGDIIITDVLLPDENGLDLIPRIRKLRPDLRIVVMSAQNTLMTAVKAAERGAFEYLPKPFDIAELVSVVRRGLDERSRARDPSGETAAPEQDNMPLIGRSPAMQEIYRVLARTHGHRPFGRHQRRIGHRQGTRCARSARLRQAPQRAVRCHQHGLDSERAHRKRLVRSRKRRLHRRLGAICRALRAGRARDAVSR